MTFDEFLATAKEQYGVRFHRLRTTSRIEAVVLMRPQSGGNDARVSPRPNLQLDDEMPARVIDRLCRDLDMRRADFGLFP
jgi:hypothetical protein